MRSTLILFVALALAACADDSDESADLTRDGGSDGARMFSPRSMSDAAIPPMGFEYAMVASLRGVNSIGRTEPTPETSHPGADIDAIELIKADGRSMFAAAVPMAKEMVGLSDDVLGAPNGCDGFVSLGESGAIRVTFGERIQPGDTIVVHELETCGDTETIGTKLESYFVFVGIADMPEDAAMIGPRGGSEGTGMFPVEL